MHTLYDYLPSQNGYKIRLLLSHLGQACHTQFISIFEGDGQRPEYLSINPTGAVPALRLDDGRVLSESNAILGYLAEGTRYLPEDRFGRAKVAQWLSFEADYVQATIGSLRHWVMTGKADRRPQALLDMKRAGGRKALEVLDRELAARPFLLGEDYTIADMSVFAYGHRADEAGIGMEPFGNVLAWIARVRAQPGFLDRIHPYAIDPHSAGELP
ncbi:glutathione S-transferase family protein [Montanilutibacter psychrotolerans]|uniref:Glutathione S-transferase family protein n=1 Tax=Montanilutibacter psychrotolerans TaxID=1327343 RepID=A0A3M8SLJ9_9GAMM|nr:glutathione S-transferase family protein [Lysobacter psychrotolerans]RNF82228.1 glutathione S-transferase family protein [Lysobacter psychrotolerans]